MAKIENPFNIKGTNLVTYAGEAEWCKYLLKSMNKSQYSPRGEYSVNLLANPEAPDYLAFKAKVELMIDTAYDEAMAGDKLGASKKKVLKKVYPFKDHIMKEKDDDGKYTIEVETGKMMIVPKLKNVLDRDVGRDYIKLLGEGNREVPRDLCPEVGNGSIVKCKVYVNPYYMATTGSIGVSFSWGAMKIIELKEFGGGDSGENFDEDEGFTPDVIDNSMDDDTTAENGDY